mmetsp:Transcript_42028/g.119312  ORF Transcript_42028/g.119312 Transcript_42028/m.119312 type:complete len:343 (-) Transcript_42028:525-1553(-)
MKPLDLPSQRQYRRPLPPAGFLPLPLPPLLPEPSTGTPCLKRLTWASRPPGCLTRSGDSLPRWPWRCWPWPFRYMCASGLSCMSPPRTRLRTCMAFSLSRGVAGTTRRRRIPLTTKMPPGGPPPPVEELLTLGDVPLVSTRRLRNSAPPRRISRPPGEGGAIELGSCRGSSGWSFRCGLVVWATLGVCNSRIAFAWSAISLVHLKSSLAGGAWEGKISVLRCASGERTAAVPSSMAAVLTVAGSCFMAGLGESPRSRPRQSLSSIGFSYMKAAGTVPASVLLALLSRLKARLAASLPSHDVRKASRGMIPAGAASLCWVVRLLRRTPLLAFHCGDTQDEGFR